MILMILSGFKFYKRREKYVNYDTYARARL